MRKFGLIPSHFWQSDSFSAMPIETKLTAVYLLSNHHSNIVHLYKLRAEYAAIDLGISTQQYETAMVNLVKCDFCLHDSDNNVVWIRSAFIGDFGAEINPHDKRIIGLQNFEPQLPDSWILDIFYHEFGKKFKLKSARFKKALASPLASPHARKIEDRR